MEQRLALQTRSKRTINPAKIIDIKTALRNSDIDEEALTYANALVNVYMVLLMRNFPGKITKLTLIKLPVFSQP